MAPAARAFARSFMDDTQGPRIGLDGLGQGRVAAAGFGFGFGFGVGVGAQLHAARDAKSMSVDAVCQQTRMSRPIVLAIEAERWQDLPGDFYARGFIRLYAESVGLDGDRIVESFDANRRIAFADDEAPTAHAPAWFERPKTSRGPSPAQVFMLIVTVATIVVFMLSAQRQKSPVKVAANPVVTSPVSGATASSPVLPVESDADAAASGPR